MYFDDLMIQALQYRLLQAWSRGGRGGLLSGIRTRRSMVSGERTAKAFCGFVRRRIRP